MQALTTIFNAPSWCLTRFAVAIDNNPFHSSTLSPSRGWADPSFSKCMPSQATEPAQTLSPGVCPGYMSIARTTSNVESGKTIWTGGCCQSGFSDMSTYFCTSTVTTPMAFLLLPNITTTDIYTTLSSMWIEHDQMTVVWEETDLRVLPKEVATNYAAIMGITVATTTESPTTSTTTTTQTWTAQHPSEKTSSTIAASTSTTVSSMTSSVTSSTVTLAIDPLPTISSTTTGTSHPSSTSSLSRTSNSGSERARSNYNLGSGYHRGREFSVEFVDQNNLKVLLTGDWETIGGRVGGWDKHRLNSPRYYAVLVKNFLKSGSTV